MKTFKWPGALCAALLAASVVPARAADLVIGVPN